MTRGLRGVAVARGLLDPRRHGFYAVQLFTHKVLRRLMAIPLLVIAATSLDAVGRRADLSARGPRSGRVYGLGAIGLALRDRRAGRRPWFAHPGLLRARQHRVAPRALESRDRPADRSLAAGPSRRTPVGRQRATATGGAAHERTRRDGPIDRSTTVRGRVVGPVGDRRSHRSSSWAPLAAGILAADAPLLAVAGASALFLAVAIVLRPDIATLTTIAILYSNAAVVAVRFHGVPFFVGAVVPLLLVVPLARDLVVRRLPVIAPPTMGWMVVLLGIYLVSALFSSDTKRSWDAVVVFLVEGFGLYFLLINVIRTPEMLRLGDVGAAGVRRARQPACRSTRC